MLYKEFKATYKWMIKHYPETSGLYRDNPEKNIICTTIHQEKNGSRWTTTSETTETVDFIYYSNVVDAVPFFRNLGGSETVQKAYTKAGYIPTRIISTNPTKTERTIREFTF